ncbi:MAG TPA: hypothetical protein DHV37_05940 [Erysipelotrichaceae bacterium]|nr:hypothetical protein [Erysipelotrichaceae bacterium]
MSSVKFKKDSKEWKMFKDLWDMCQRFWIPESTKEYWDEVSDAVESFNSKYSDIHPMVRELCIAFLEGLDKKQQENM